MSSGRDLRIGIIRTDVHVGYAVTVKYGMPTNATEQWVIIGIVDKDMLHA